MIQVRYDINSISWLHRDHIHCLSLVDSRVCSSWPVELNQKTLHGAWYNISSEPCASLEPKLAMQEGSRKKQRSNVGTQPQNEEIMMDTDLQPPLNLQHQQLMTSRGGPAGPSWSCKGCGRCNIHHVSKSRGVKI